VTTTTGQRRKLEAPLVVALIGLSISVYLTVEHFTGSTTLACPEGATVNCARVTSSQWSTLAGVPVAVLGLAYFVVMTLLLTPMAWRRRAFGPVRIAGAVAGVAMVLYLIWIELFKVNAICLWCTAVHAVTVVLLGTVLWRTVSSERT
jgi:uncharacterized membrane protein